MTHHQRLNLTCATVFTIMVLFAAWYALPQTPAPTLSTADRVAINTFEKAKQDAQKEFDGAQQGELTVLREWGNAHPGWHVNQQTFAVEKDAVPPPPDLHKPQVTQPPPVVAPKPPEKPAEVKK